MFKHVIISEEAAANIYAFQRNCLLIIDNKITFPFSPGSKTPHWQVVFLRRPASLLSNLLIFYSNYTLFESPAHQDDLAKYSKLNAFAWFEL